MPWVKVDDHFDEHPKFAQCGPLGIALWLAGLAYCNRNLLDGHIPWAKARSLLSWQYLGPMGEDGRQKVYTIGITCGMQGDDVNSEQVIELLVECGLWEIEDGGYYVHDYPVYQLMKEQVLLERNAERDQRSAAGKRSAEARRAKYGSAQPQKPNGPNEAPNEAPNGHRTPYPSPVPITTTKTDYIAPASPHLISADSMQATDTLLKLRQWGASQIEAQSVIQEFPGKPPAYLQKVIETNRQHQLNGNPTPTRKPNATDRTIARLISSGKVKPNDPERP